MDRVHVVELLDVSFVFPVIVLYLSCIGCSRGVGLPVSGGVWGPFLSFYGFLWWSPCVSHFGNVGVGWVPPELESL